MLYGNLVYLVYWLNILTTAVLSRYLLYMFYIISFCFIILLWLCNPVSNAAILNKQLTDWLISNGNCFLWYMLYYLSSLTKPKYLQVISHVVSTDKCKRDN